MAEADALRAHDTGLRVVRGGAVRAAGYGITTLLAAVGSVFLLRHLGVVEFGRYTTVVAVIGIVTGITDAGMTVVGTRELALTPVSERRRLVESMVGIRLALAIAGVAAALLFGIAAGYDDTLLAGILLAGAGMVLIVAHAAMTLPLAVELRNVRITLVEVLKQVVTVGGIAALAVAGAELLPFFAVQIVVGLVIIVTTPLVLGRGVLRPPRYERSAWSMLIREALPIAAATVIGVVYFRLLVVMMSVVSDERELGLFATSFRVVEMLVAVPLLLTGVVLPVASAAAGEDRARLRFIIQQTTEVALPLGAFLAIATAIVAEPAIVLLGGEEYRGAGSVLAIQGFALVGIFLTQAWTLGLVALRRQRLILVVTAIGFGAILVLGGVLVPLFDATGAAAAAVAADTLLAVLTLVALRRTGERVSFHFLPRALAALVLPAALAFAPGPAGLRAALAGLLLVAGMWALRLIPNEVLDAAPLPAWVKARGSRR